MSIKDKPNPLKYDKNSEHLLRLAYDLLFGWKLIPGLKDNGTVDASELNLWVETARDLAIQNKRLASTDFVLGRALSHSPKDSDGAWPAKPIRDLLDNVNSDRLNQGFITQTFNNRGSTSRGLLDGGGQERELAERFKQYADVIRDLWPITASVLDKIAKDYLSDARRHDLGAELEEDLW